MAANDKNPPRFRKDDSRLRRQFIGPGRLLDFSFGPVKVHTMGMPGARKLVFEGICE
jgi:hypothetical protein